MNAVLIDPKLTDESRRREVYDGQLIVYSPTPSSLALVELARQLIRDAFGALDPETAQYHMPVETYVQVLADLKPKFIHHPESKRCIQKLLCELDCDPGRTYFDVPRMRSATSDAYLTSGIAYAFHPHRDTWYSAPPCQVNFWIPVYDVESGRAMAFHPRYWSERVPNSSRLYNYAEWNRTSRYAAASQITGDTRVQPRAEGPIEMDPQIRVLTPVGGILMFSAAQLHSTVPNATGRTRFSVDFRVVNIDDARAGRGAPNVDSDCTGTTMGDYLRVDDLSHIPDDLVERYAAGIGRLLAPPTRA